MQSRKNGRASVDAARFETRLLTVRPGDDGHDGARQRRDICFDEFCAGHDGAVRDR
jgi:hypothetical protein